MSDHPSRHRNRTGTGTGTATGSGNEFGLIGLAVMGQNLVLNVESRGFSVSVLLLSHTS